MFCVTIFACILLKEQRWLLLNDEFYRQLRCAGGAGTAVFDKKTAERIFIRVVVYCAVPIFVSGFSTVALQSAADTAGTGAAEACECENAKANGGAALV